MKLLLLFFTAQNTKFSIKDFFNKFDPYLLKESLVENFIFCAVLITCKQPNYQAKQNFINMDVIHVPALHHFVRVNLSWARLISKILITVLANDHFLHAVKTLENLLISCWFQETWFSTISGVLIVLAKN